MTRNSSDQPLDWFAAPESDAPQIATFETDELTALCPFEFGGPDYYTLVIRYEPRARCLESRSLKQWLESFREEETTAEELAAGIHGTVSEAIAPERLYVRLEQARRGGIEETVEVGNVDLR